MIHSLSILSSDLLPAYLGQISETSQTKFDQLDEALISDHDFKFYTSVASVFSSKIEGEEIDLDSYVKHKRFDITYQPDYTKKIDDLYEAYIFAQNHKLTKSNLEAAHKLLSRNLLPENKQGTYRTVNMYVTTPDGKIEYVATSPYDVASEMNRYFIDLKTLLQSNLSFEETFFFASFLHLLFVKIHSWYDGNGRCARLIEKWFLAEKLGPKAWYLQSEKMYYTHHNTYYNNLRLLGLEYEHLNFLNALPFVLMLPESLDHVDDY